MNRIFFLATVVSKNGESPRIQLPMSPLRAIRAA
jgi:hypothetical protein